MEQETYTFEQLPMAVASLNMKMDRLISRFEETFSKTENSEKGHELLDLPAAARMLGKAESTIYSMTSSRIIPFHKRGNKLYFFKDELTAWIESGGQSGMANDEDFNRHLAQLQSGKRRKAAAYNGKEGGLS